MKNINVQIWFNLNKEGYIIDSNKKIIIRPLLEREAVYVYKLSLENEEKYYIESTTNMIQRFRQHKYRAYLHSKKFEYNSLLYNNVAIHGWDKFKLGIIAYLDFYPENEWSYKKEQLLKLEQKYLNLLSPELNINKTAGSMLGFKHIENNKSKLTLINKSSKDIKDVTYLKPLINKETILKLKLHNKSITVSIYNKNYELVKKFNRIKIAAEFVGLSPSTVSGYIKTGKLWNNKYYFKLKTNTILEDNNLNFPLDNKERIMIKSNNSINNSYNSYKLEVLYKDKVIYKFRSIREASKFLNISKITLMKYSIENKLWKHKFKFRINSN